MKQRVGASIKRIPLKSVGIEETVKRRLVSYLETLRPRPSEAQMVSVAVQEYLDRVETEER